MAQIESTQIQFLFHEIESKCEKTQNIFDEFYSDKKHASLEINSINGKKKSDYLTMQYTKYFGQETGSIKLINFQNGAIIYQDGKLKCEISDLNLSEKEFLKKMHSLMQLNLKVY
ncbi:hypothetical protein DSAG12_01627 [Promethearchaeum syntrophicum]|uniref:Uncharacterized protein n=1 Tax=Promethearchaeum syntrophicum TaxID=2594042 RepID=A0A5B9DAL1_9ARCH|nr:hypothetical protein [Candidatus Prometheoarchaeum syntrophicum]QEE15800.1 hypothetical protein DSAG12_01627 [Candidatus Prometheoarchaeum syntrophicum]